MSIFSVGFCTILEDDDGTIKPQLKVAISVGSCFLLNEFLLSILQLSQTILQS